MMHKFSLFSYGSFTVLALTFKPKILHFELIYVHGI